MHSSIALGGGGHEAELDLTRDHGRDLEHLARRGRERLDAQRDGLPHAGRDGAGGCGQRLADEEGVAARDRVQVRRLAPGAPREQRHGLRRECLGLDPPHAFTRKRGQHAPHLGCGVVAAGEDQAAGRAQQAAAQQRDEVERGVVGPVQVFDDHHGAARQLVQGRRQHPLAGAGDGGEQLAARFAGDVVQRAERARRDQGITGTPQDPLLRSFRRRGDEDGLADPRLTGHDHDPAGRAGLRYRGLEDLAVAISFKELQRAEPNLTRGPWPLPPARGRAGTA